MTRQQRRAQERRIKKAESRSAEYNAAYYGELTHTVPPRITIYRNESGQPVNVWQEVSGRVPLKFQSDETIYCFDKWYFIPENAEEREALCRKCPLKFVKPTTEEIIAASPERARYYRAGYLKFEKNNLAKDFESQ